MHESGIAAEILELALEQARLHEAKPVVRLGLRIGDLSGVVEEALRFAFDALKAGTLAGAAELAIERVPVKAVCRQCNSAPELPPGDLVLWCPRCGMGLDIIEGKELDLLWVELESQEGP
jgi:hydrogenase nickel incorporation protein HypA/HybF